MKLLTPVSYLLIIGLFFLSFCEFKCSGNKLLELKGIEMVTGKKADKSEKHVVPDEQSTDSFLDEVSSDLRTEQNIDPVVWADISFGAAILGLTIFLIMASVGRLGTGKIFYLITGAIGAISHFLIKVHIEGEMADKQENLEMITVEFTAAYWIAFVLFLVIIIVNLIPDFKLVRQQATDAPEENKDYFQNLGNIE